MKYAGTNLMRFCSFRLADRLFGVDIKDVKEIGSDVQVTSIPHAPPAVCGYMNIRGQIHLVIDLRALFGFERVDVTSDTKVVIFKPCVDEPFGVIVDGVADVVEADERDIVERRTGEDTDDTPGAEKRNAPKSLSMGVTRLKSELMIVLNARGILDAVHTHEVHAI